MSARAKQAYGTHAPLASKGGNTVGMGGMTAKAGVKPNMADTQRVGRAEQAVPAPTQGGKTFRCVPSPHLAPRAPLARRCAQRPPATVLSLSLSLASR